MKQYINRSFFVDKYIYVSTIYLYTKISKDTPVCICTLTESTAVDESPKAHILSNYSTTCVVVTQSNKKFNFKCTWMWYIC